MSANYHFEQDKIAILENLSLIKISGDNAGDFLQGQLTCDVTQISEQKSSLSALCNPQGRVLAVVILFKKGADYYCCLPRCISENFITHLMRFAVFSKVTLEDVTSAFFLYGFVGGVHAEKLNSIVAATLPVQPYETIVTSSDLILAALPGCETRYLLWGPVEQQDRVSAFFIKNDFDESSWKISTILSKTPFVYANTLAAVTPHMLNLHLLDAISFSKGCYVGQEIIARTHYLGKSKRHLYLAEIMGSNTIHPGEVLQANEQEVGLIIDAVAWEQNSLVLAVIHENAVGQDIFSQSYPCQIIVD